MAINLTSDQYIPLRVWKDAHPEQCVFGVIDRVSGRFSAYCEKTTREIEVKRREGHFVQEIVNWSGDVDKKYLKPLLTQGA